MGAGGWWAIEESGVARASERGTCGGATWELSAEAEDGGTEVSAAPPSSLPSPSGPSVREAVEGEWGTFDVECRDTWAYGVGVRPDERAGWRVVS